MEKKDLELRLQQLRNQEFNLQTNLNAVKGAIRITEEYLSIWEKGYTIVDEKDVKINIS